MRTLFILCTAVTVIQIFDVSITAVSALAGDPAKPPNRTVKSSANTAVPGSPRVSTRAVKKPSAAQSAPVDSASKPDSVDKEPGTNPNDDDSEEGEQPQTIKESGKKAAQTLKKMADRRGAGLINGFTGLLKKSGGALNFFGNFLRDRSNNVKDVAKDSLGVVSSFSDSSSKGARHVLNSGRVIGTQAGKELYSTLQKATTLGKSATKLGGAVVGTPLSIGNDVVGTANRVARVPSKLSRMVTHGAINPILDYLGPDSGEEEAEEEAEAEVEDKKEESPKAATKAPPSPRKPANKKT